MQDIDSARLYTDFGGLARLKAKAGASPDGAGSQERAEASREVARQFEAMFLQTMLKTMREASQLSETTESDHTRFYMEMFDKQIAIDLASRGDGIGLGDMLEQQLSGKADINTRLVQQQLSKMNDTYTGGER